MKKLFDVIAFSVILFVVCILVFFTGEKDDQHRV